MERRKSNVDGKREHEPFAGELRPRKEGGRAVSWHFLLVFSRSCWTHPRIVRVRREGGMGQIARQVSQLITRAAVLPGDSMLSMQVHRSATSRKIGWIACAWWGD